MRHVGSRRVDSAAPFLKPRLRRPASVPWPARSRRWTRIPNRPSPIRTGRWPDCFSRLRAPAAEGLRRFPWRPALLRRPSPPRRLARRPFHPDQLPDRRPRGGRHRRQPADGLGPCRLRRRPLPSRVVYRPRADPDLRPAPLRPRCVLQRHLEGRHRRRPLGPGTLGRRPDAAEGEVVRASRRSGPGRRGPGPRVVLPLAGTLLGRDRASRCETGRAGRRRREGRGAASRRGRPRPERGPCRRREAPGRVRARADGAPRRVAERRRGRGQPPR